MGNVVGARSLGFDPYLGTRSRMSVPGAWSEYLATFDGNSQCCGSREQKKATKSGFGTSSCYDSGWLDTIIRSWYEDRCRHTGYPTELESGIPICSQQTTKTNGIDFFPIRERHNPGAWSPSSSARLVKGGKRTNSVTFEENPQSECFWRLFAAKTCPDCDASAKTWDSASRFGTWTCAKRNWLWEKCFSGCECGRISCSPG